MLLIPPAKISKIFWTGESEGADTNTGHLGLFLLPAGTTALLLTGEFSEAPGPPLPACQSAIAMASSHGHRHRPPVACSSTPASSRRSPYACGVCAALHCA